MQVLRDIVAAVAGADHQRLFAFPFLAVVISAGMQDRTGEVFQAGNIGHTRNPADAGGQHDMARMHRALAAVGPAQRHGPAFFLFIIAATLELGTGPVVELHTFDIGLEPVGQFVLGNVGRPVRWKRHVGKVIDLHLVMQRQRMVAIAPVVADARLAVHDQRVDLQLLQPCGDAKSGLSAADDQNGRIAVGIFGSGFPQVEPVGAAKIARIGLAAGPRYSELLFKTFQFVERREQRPGFDGVAVAGIWNQPQNPAAAALRGFKLEDRLDGIGAGAHPLARRGPIGIDRKTGGPGAPCLGFQRCQDCIGAVEGLDVPA